jgi:hypothetical protein
MMELNEKQVEQVEQQLIVHGINMYELRQSLLDHVCCLIEEKLEYGKAFSDAFEEAFNAFGDYGLLRIQNETEELLNQKENPMKQLTFISGIIAGALIAIGGTFKIFHWPGANILTLLGMITLIFVFLPSIFISKYKTEFNIAGKISQLAGMLSIALFILGGVFKFMHWPMATMLMYAGAASALLIYLPLLMYKNSLEKSTAARNKYVLVTFTLSIAMMIFLSLRSPSQKFSEGYISTNTAIEQMIAQIDAKRANSNLSNINAEHIANTDEVIKLITQLKRALIKNDLGENYNNSNIEDCQNLLSAVPVDVLLANNVTEINLLFNKMKELKLQNGTSAEAFISNYFESKSLITAYSNLSAFELQVKQQMFY